MLLVSSHTMPGYIHNNGTGGLKLCCWYPHARCQRYIRNNGVGWSCYVVGILTHNATLHTQQRRRVVLRCCWYPHTRCPRYIRNNGRGGLKQCCWYPHTRCPRYIRNNGTGGLRLCCWYPHARCQRYIRNNGRGGLAKLLVSSHTMPTLHTQQRRRVVLSNVVGILTHNAHATYATTASGGLANCLR